MSFMLRVVKVRVGGSGYGWIGGGEEKEIVVVVGELVGDL